MHTSENDSIEKVSVVQDLFKVITPLLLLLLLFSTSCNHQASSPAGNKNPDSISLNHFGDAVHEIGKSAWLIYQDSKNNYWFGSNGLGVYHYDPNAALKKITRFTTKNGLCNDTVWEIQEDRFGNIYFTTIYGISRFDGKSFSTLAVDRSKPGEWKSGPGDLWFKGGREKNGPYRYDGNKLYSLEFPKHYMEDEFYAQNGRHPWSPYEVYCIYKDSRKNIWFGTANFGLCRFDGKNLSWLYEEHLTLVKNGGSFGIRSIIEDKNGKFWFCNTMYRFTIYPEDSIDRLGNHFIHYKREKGMEHLLAPSGLDHVYFLSVTEDSNKNLWLASYSEGVFECDPGLKEKNPDYYIVREDGHPITLFSIYRDRNGKLWLGTHEEGPYFFNGTGFEKFHL